MGKDLFDTEDYRAYLRAWGKARKRGEFRKIALALSVHTTFLSQVLGGRKGFTEEQGAKLCVYLQLSPLESDYLLKLIQLDRAGNEPLRQILKRQLLELRARASEAKHRVPIAKTMNAADQAVFYSSWHYALIRLLTTIPRYQSPDAIAERLEISATRVREVLTFLVSRGLCAASAGGKFRRTDRNTHVEARSPLAVRHHQNWRMRAVEMQERLSSDDLCFTAPVSLSKADFGRVKAQLLATIAEAARTIEDSPPEEIAYFGIDWIRM